MLQAALTAVIAGIFAVISSAVTLYLKHRIEDRGKEPITDDERAALTGRWHVKIEQSKVSSSQPALRQEFDLPLTVRGRTIEGEFAHERPGCAEGYPSTVTGSLIPNRFV